MTFRPPWTVSWLLGAVLSFQVAISLAMAQQTPPSTTEGAPQGQSPTSKSASEKQDTPANNQKPQNDRIFFALPNYLTVENASSLPPLSVRQKFKMQVLGTFDRAEYPWIGLVAAVNQASHSDPAFGQGLRGYAKRYGTAFGDNLLGNFMTGAVFPSLLREDPRFYRMGKGGFLHRARYAAFRIFVIRSDSGRQQFNFSELLGNGAAGAIANVYHPAPRSFANGFDIWWTQTAWDAAAYELKEFWPDLRHALRPHASAPTQ